MRGVVRTAVLALLGAAALGAWGFSLRKGKQAERVALALDQAEHTARQFQETLRRLAEDEEARRNEQTTASDVLAAWEELLDQGMIAILERVEAHASHAGVTVDDVALAPEPPEGRMVWRVAGFGPVTPVASFLSLLENDPGFSVLTRLDVDPLEDGLVTFAVDVTMFEPAS